MKCYVKEFICHFPYHKVLNIHKETLPPLACLCLAFTAELFICFLPPQRSSSSPNQVHPWNNLIEKIMSKQASAIKFHQATFFALFHRNSR